VKPLTPSEIEQESMRIIDREAGDHPFTDREWYIVRRIIHATADFDYMKSVVFSPRSADGAVEALQGGSAVYVDTRMLEAGVHKQTLSDLGCRLISCISDVSVIAESKETGRTRSACAVRKAAPELDGAVIVIGNAPTALHEAVTLYEEGRISPAIIIGLPVGFVEAQESKQLLSQCACRHITNAGRKGGTPAAAAAVNALLQLAGS
jgi:precorrin-8X/cobalt-precorrin-8 methylmutase